MKKLPACIFDALAMFLSLLLFISNSHLSCGQTDTKELESKLRIMNDDTAKVNTLINLGENYCSIKNDKALMFLQEAFTIATAEKYESGIGRSLMWQGRVYYYKDDYPLAIKYLEKARVILEGENEESNLAFIYFAKGEIYRIMGDYIHALESYTDALRIAESLDDKKWMSTFYGSIGRVHLDRKEPKKAMGYFRESLRKKQLIDDQKGISNLYTCMGMSFEELNQLDSALIYHSRALQIRSRLHIDRAVAGSEYNKGGILIKLNKPVEAEQSLLTALSIFTELKEKTGIIITSLRLAEARNIQGKANAVQLAIEALEMARQINNPNLISHGCKILSGIYFKQSFYKESYKYLEKYNKLQDSILSTEKERMLTEFEAKFQSEKKDNQIKLLKQETETHRKNNILLIILIVVFAVVIVLLFLLFRLKSTAFNRQQKLREQKNIIHTQEQKLIEQENQILQEQLESKNRELASKALEMLRFNETISSIIEKLDSLNNSFNSNDEAVKPIKDIIHKLENQTKQNIWTEFEKIFKNIHSGFYDKLLEICPELTATEIKTAALLKLNLNTKEIAAIAFKSEGGIKTTRYRLRKKLKLKGDDKLVPFLMQI